MAVVTQELVDTFAAKLVSKLSFLTMGADKTSRLEGEQTDKKITLRVIDPSGAVSEDRTTVGSNTNAVTFNDFAEKKIELALIHYWTGVKASIVDKAASMSDAQLRAHIEKEAQNLAVKILSSAIDDMIYRPNRAFVGGWEELNAASGDLAGNFEGKIFGFINAKARAKLAVSQPFGDRVGEALYKASEIGAGADGSYYYNEKKMPTVVIDSTAAGATLTVSAIAKNGNGELSELKLTASSSCTLPKGTPITLVGLKACDGLGNVTDEDAVVVLKEDAALTSSATSIVGKIDKVIVSGAGRQIADDDGTDVASGDCTSATIPAAGTYFVGMLRLDNFASYGTIEKLQTEDASHEVANVDGINVHVTKFSGKDKVDMVDYWRFDVYIARGIVDPRGTSYVLIRK